MMLARIWNHIDTDVYAILLMAFYVTLAWLGELLGFSPTHLMIGFVGFLACKSHVRLERMQS